LNVQAICDVKKRFLWASTGHQGSNHDSSAFSDTQLCDLLIDMNEKLKSSGYFIVGDSAYALSAFLVVPFASPKGGSTEDAFNFWLSNSRIRIECAFGELVMRFGIFWRSLRFNLKECGDIITGAMLLHNFLVDHRDRVDVDFFSKFSMQTILDETPILGLEIPMATVTDNNADKPMGRRPNDETERHEEGERVRENLRAVLEMNQKPRILRKGAKVNMSGNVYFDY